MRFHGLLTKFSTKVTLSILAIGMASVLVGLGATYLVGKNNIQNNIGNQYARVAHETGKVLRLHVEHSVRAAQVLALASDVRTGVSEANRIYSDRNPAEADLRKRAETLNKLYLESPDAESRIQEFLRDPASRFIREASNETIQKKEWISVVVTDKKGFLVATEQRPQRMYFGEEDWWQAAFNKGLGSIFISDIHPYSDMPGTPDEERFSLGIAVPVMDENDARAIGVLKTELRARIFFNTVTGVHIGRSDHTMLASSDGTLIFCPVFKILAHRLDQNLMDTVFKDSPGWSLTRSDIHYKDRVALNGFAPFAPGPEAVNYHPSSFGGKEWFIFTSQDPVETYAPVRELLNWIFLIGIFTIGILLVLGFRAAEYIVRPLKDLQKGAQLIGYGNLEHRLKIDTKDEIQELADEFNEMAIKLQASYAGLEQRVAARTRELEVVNKITRIISSSLDLKAVFDSFCEEVYKLLPSDRISMSLMDENNQQIQLRLIKTRDEPLATRETPRSKTGTVIEWVTDHGKPMVRNDTDEHAEFAEDRMLRKEGFRSYISVPIFSKEAVIGTLNLISRRANAYGEKNLDILEPITEQMGIAIATNRLFEQTKKLDQLKSDFVSKVSHEFRTPLTSIKGFSEILLSYQDVDRKAQREFISIINEESERLTRLINNILDLSKIESGSTDWVIKPVAPLNMVIRAVNMVQALKIEKNLPVDVDVPPDLPKIRGDSDKLIQVMENLLSNAIKFTIKGSIKVRAIPIDGFVRFSVSDTGVGIAPEDTDRIFQRFVQIGSAKEGSIKGTGLGLSICREIIQYLEGKIWCESRPGEGSTFHFELPVWNEDEAPVADSERPQTESEIPPLPT